MNFPLIFGFNYANITFGQQIGDWSNGMIGVSKTFGGSSILSSPAFVKTSELIREFGCFAFTHISFGHVPTFFAISPVCGIIVTDWAFLLCRMIFAFVRKNVQFVKNQVNLEEKCMSRSGMHGKA